MIMLGPLEPSARARVPWSFVAPRACAVVAFGRPRFGTAQVEWHLAIVDPLRLGVAARGARPGQLPTIAGHRPSYDAKSPFRLSTERVDYAPVAPTTYGRAIRSGSTFSPPAICGCDGTKPLRASRCLTSSRANANAGLKHSPPHISQLIHVVGMNGRRPAPSNGLCLRKPGVLQPSAIQVFRRTIDARQPHQSRNGIERCVELAVSHGL